MEHTKTPWVCGRPGYYGFCDIYGENDPKSKTICSVTTESDAAHIVRCVNVHDALVEALHDAMVALISLSNNEEGEERTESLAIGEAAIVSIEAALALAEK